MVQLAPAGPGFGLAPHILAMLRGVCAQFPAIDKVLVFGSRARGDFRPSSDIDLAVYASTMSDAEFARLWNALDDLPIIFTLDVLHVDRVANGALLEKIGAEGVPLGAG